MTNFIPLREGGVARRPGMEDLGASLGGPSYQTRLITFSYSEQTNYVVELNNNGGCRVWVDDVVGNCASVSGSLFSNGIDLNQVHYAQDGDRMFLVHPKVEPMVLTRTGATTFSLARAFNGQAGAWPPMLDPNTTATTLRLLVGSGVPTLLTASGGIFTANDIGRYYTLTHLTEAEERALDLDATASSSTLTVRGDWELRTTGIWSGVLEVERSTNGGSTWSTIRTYSGSDDRNVAVAGTEEDEDVLLRLTFTLASGWTPPSGAATPKAYLSATPTLVTGLVRATDYLNATTLEVDIVVEPASYANTRDWRAGAFYLGTSSQRGWPAAVVMHEQRLWFGGTERDPQRLWGSVLGDFTDFRDGTEDDDAVSYVIAGGRRDQIRWLSSNRTLIVGTDGGVFAFGSLSDGGPLTPGNASVGIQTQTGMAYIAPVASRGSLLAISRDRRRVIELGYQVERDALVDADLTTLASHLFETNTIVATAFQEQPQPILWAVDSEGRLLGMTYSREQQVVAWHVHTTQTGSGEIKAVTVKPGASADEVWLVVGRSNGSGAIQRIERLSPFAWTALEDAFHLDSARTYSGSPATVITGLSHLNGLLVTAFADGVNYSGLAVSGGQVTLPRASSTVHVGISYASSVETMPLDSGPQGFVGGLRKHIRRVLARVYRTRGLVYGFNGALGVVEVPRTAYDFRQFQQDMDAAPPMVTGWLELRTDTLRPEADPAVFITLTTAEPLTILALNVFYEITEQ